MQKNNSQPTGLTKSLRKRFFHQNLLNEPEREPDMEWVLHKLEKKRTRKIDFRDVLFILKRAKLQEKRNIQHKKTFSELEGSTWEKEKRKVHKSLDTLIGSLLTVYMAVDDHPNLKRLIFSGLKNNKYLPEEDGVLKHLEKLNEAVKQSPILQLSRKRGQQPQPWVKEAEKQLKSANVPKALADNLLRLIGLKPFC